MPSKAPKTGDVRAVLVEAARVQLAAMTGAIKLWSTWAESADRYTRALGGELERLDQGAGSKEAVARMADLSRQYLRHLAEIPGIAYQQFSQELERVAKPKPGSKRKRAVRTKP